MGRRDESRGERGFSAAHSRRPRDNAPDRQPAHVPDWLRAAWIRATASRASSMSSVFRTTARLRRSISSCNRWSARDSSFIATRCPALATGTANARQDLEALGSLADLRLESRRGEEQVEDDARGTRPRRRQSGCRQAAQRHLLERRLEAIALRAQIADQASAAASSATATATSTSRVKRGSARMETARPPTRAHGSCRESNSSPARRSASSRRDDSVAWVTMCGEDRHPPWPLVDRAASPRAAPRAGWVRCQDVRVAASRV